MVSVYIMSTTESNLQKNTESKTSRLLVICVDRDDDIGKKGGVATPVVGRNACIDAAQRLALEDPEDADSNSIFAAVKTYEDLVSKGYQAEVIIVSGTEDKGVEADEKIVLQVKSVMEKYAANGAVIVSDGEDDESVIPIIQNVLPIVSVRRVVMRVSRSVEYSYAVFGRYLKAIAFDSKYSKFFLGVPGILLLIGGIATVLGLTREIFAILVSILGGAFLIRAFDVDRAWSHWVKPTPAGFIRIFTMVTGILLILVSIPSGLSAVNPDIITTKPDILKVVTDKVVVGTFVSGMLPFLWMGIGSMFGGSLLSSWFKGSMRSITDILRIVVLITLYPIVFQFTTIMTHNESPFTLLPPLLLGLAVILISASVLFHKYRRKKGGEVLSE
jgi:putative membrane protein